MRFSCRMSFASSRLMPGLAVTRLSLVITSATGRSRRFWKRRSRWVRMPTRRPSRVTGRPEIVELLHDLERVGDALVGMAG